MKKKVMILLVIIVIGFIGYKVLYNGFLNIKRITIHSYNQPSYDDIVTIDKKKIAIITGILNRAKHERVSYKLANEASYEMIISYEDKSDERLGIYPGFDDDKTLLYGNGNAYFINDKQTKKLLNLLLKEE